MPSPLCTPSTAHPHSQGVLRGQTQVSVRYRDCLVLGLQLTCTYSRGVVAEFKRDVGDVPMLEMRASTPYIIMEDIDGQSLVLGMTSGTGIMS